MTNEKSLQVAQGLSILSLLIASGRIDGEKLAHAIAMGAMALFADSEPGPDGDEDRARFLDAIEMVSP